jgi:hypothetical protein
MTGPQVQAALDKSPCIDCLNEYNKLTLIAELLFEILQRTSPSTTTVSASTVTLTPGVYALPAPAAGYQRYVTNFTIEHDGGPGSVYKLVGVTSGALLYSVNLTAVGQSGVWTPSDFSTTEALNVTVVTGFNSGTFTFIYYDLPI